MSDTRGDLQFWQTIAGIVGTGLAALIVGLGRRAGALARRPAEAEPGGDVLQREILDQLKRDGEATTALAEEIRGLRGDWQAKRDADEQRRREQRDRSVDDQLDDLRHGQSVARRGQNETKILLRELIERLPGPVVLDRRGTLAAPAPDPAADKAP